MVTALGNASQPSLENVLQQHPVWRGQGLARVSERISSGYEELDACLPGGGWPAGALTEVLGDREGVGELQLVLPALAALTTRGKRVAWLAPPHLPYAPALAAAGIDLAHLIVVRAPGRRDALWAAEQVLRAGSCHALLAWLPNARYEELRRLAVAAESSHACALLFRPRAASAESSPAALRLAFEPSTEGLAVRLIKRRGAALEAPLLIPIQPPFHALARPAFPLPAPRRA